jgi:hypothetical protein
MGKNGSVLSFAHPIVPRPETATQLEKTLAVLDNP